MSIIQPRVGAAAPTLGWIAEVELRQGSIVFPLTPRLIGFNSFRVGLLPCLPRVALLRNPGLDDFHPFRMNEFTKLLLNSPWVSVLLMNRVQFRR